MTPTLKQLLSELNYKQLQAFISTTRYNLDRLPMPRFRTAKQKEHAKALQSALRLAQGIANKHPDRPEQLKLL